MRHGTREMPRSRVRLRPGRTFAVAAGLATLALLQSAHGAIAAPGQGSIYAAIRQATAHGALERTRPSGVTHTPFEETLSEGALLIGFELGVGKFLDKDVIYALRGIYRTSNAVLTSKDHGLFGNIHLPNKKIIKSKVV